MGGAAGKRKKPRLVFKQRGDLFTMFNFFFNPSIRFYLWLFLLLVLYLRLKLLNLINQRKKKNKNQKQGKTGCSSATSPLNNRALAGHNGYVFTKVRDIICAIYITHHTHWHEDLIRVLRICSARKSKRESFTVLYACRTKAVGSTIIWIA